MSKNEKKRTQRITLPAAKSSILHDADTIRAIIRNLDCCAAEALTQISATDATPGHPILNAAVQILRNATGTRWAEINAGLLADALANLVGDLECPRFGAVEFADILTPFEQVWTEADPPRTLYWYGHAYDANATPKATNYWQQVGAPFRTSVKLDNVWVGSYARRDAWQAVQEGRKLDGLIPDAIPRITHLHTPDRIAVAGQPFVRVRKYHSRPNLARTHQFLIENNLDRLFVEKPRHKNGAITWVHEGAYQIIQKAAAVRSKKALNSFVAGKIRELLDGADG